MLAVRTQIWCWGRGTQRGVWSCMRYATKQMEEQGGCAIVNCSSLGGLVGQSGRAAYHATKHGVLGLTKSVGME
ncbi:SDR family NAD(P)-dependent oxidoreductase [Sphingobium sp. H39-3-25]|uniref:SDR family NAD(P)-dependent oxidoreductase n=1 Tax=Sphingobium arseniciresistens TaxID=3030834 RepID=UPI0023B8EE43|nr:SDR family NAD(P)-dependent oxidoreductase [Sphingobium arseniciresistens]